MSFPAPAARVVFAVAALSLALTARASAQDALSVPRLSPHARVVQTVGLTEIAVDYHSPAARGREVFGGLVPFGVVWRAGANENTTISFTHDVTVEGQPLAAGSYGLHMVPGAERWVVIFSHETEAWGSFGYSEEQDALRVTVSATSAAHRERMAFVFDEVGDDEATLALHWTGTVVPLRIAVDTVGLVLAPVRAAANSDDDRPGWQFWFQAADFGRDHGVDRTETLDWVEHSLTVQRSFSNLWLQSELLADAGDVEQAGEVRDEALQLANAQELQGLGQRYAQRGDSANAVVVFEMVLGMGPSSWWTYVQLAKAKRKQGDDQGAIEAYRGALATNPEPVVRAEIEAKLAALEAS